MSLVSYLDYGICSSGDLASSSLFSYHSTNCFRLCLVSVTSSDDL